MESLELQWNLKKQKRGKTGPSARALINSLGIRYHKLQKSMKENMKSDVKFENSMAKLRGEGGKRGKVQNTLGDQFFKSS